MNITRFAIRHPVTVAMAAIALVSTGAVSPPSCCNRADRICSGRIS